MATKQSTTLAVHAGMTTPKRSVNGNVGRSTTGKVVAFRGNKSAAPKPVNGNVPPRRVPNAAVRTRELELPRFRGRLMS